MSKRNGSGANIKRKGIPKKIRFEVFKRDSFSCQYCGAKAPDTLLHIDHIIPVSEGGGNDLMNLITACAECNLGKSNISLSDETAVSRQRKEIEELNVRREQLEMMLKWRDELKGLCDMEVSAAAESFEVLSGESITEIGRSELKKLIKRFGLATVLDAIDVAADRYLVWEDQGCEKAEHESVLKAFSKIGGICYYSNQPRHIQELGRLRSIARKRFRYFNEHQCKEFLGALYGIGASIDDIEFIVLNATSWGTFQSACYEYLEGAGDA